jgi:adenylosuccinate lyase
MMDANKATISQLQDESNRLVSLIGEMETRLADARALLGNVRTELERRLRPVEKPTVTDHALLRYLERVHGVDVAAMKAHILTDNVTAAIHAGASSVIMDGVRFVIKGNALVTVTEAGPKAKPRKVHKGRAENGHDWHGEVDEYYATAGDPTP